MQYLTWQIYHCLPNFQSFHGLDPILSWVSNSQRYHVVEYVEYYISTTCSTLLNLRKWDPFSERSRTTWGQNVCNQQQYMTWERKIYKSYLWFMPKVLVDSLVWMRTTASVREDGGKSQYLVLFCESSRMNFQKGRAYQLLSCWFL